MDESGIDTRMSRAYARAAPGERAIGKVPGGHWERLTVIGALALDGVVASMSIAAATTGAVFLAFIEQVLIPALRGRSDAIVVLDTAAAALTQRGAQGRAGPQRARGGQHHLPWTPASARPCRTRGCRPTRLTSTHQAWNTPDPIPKGPPPKGGGGEPCWSKLKGVLRAKAARTLEALEAELGPALATITAQDAQGWFRLCGYGPPN